jgi:hypothetical protein
VKDLLGVLPPTRAYGALAVVESRKAAFLFGGYSEDLVPRHPLLDVWTLSLTGGAFMPTSVQGQVPTFIDGAIAVDQAEAVVYLHGGADPQSTVPGAALDTFARFDSASLVISALPAASGNPGPRHGHSLTWLGVAGQFVLYGGSNQGVVLGDVWRFDASEGWEHLPVVDRPSTGHVALLDETSGRMIVAGNGALAAFDIQTLQWSVLAEHPGLAAGVGAAFLDRDSRHVLTVSRDGKDVLLFRLKPDSASVTVLEASVAGPVMGALHGFDPLGRQAILFGGLDGTSGTTSALRVLPEVCP